MKHRFMILWACLGVVISPAACQAETQQDYPRRTPIVTAFEKNKDVVVSITGRQVVRRADPFWGFDDWFFPRPRLRTAPFLGSGFLLDERGYIVTNAHVVQNALEITIIMADESQHQAQLVAADRTADLALIKIESDRPLPTVVLGRSDDLMIGETVLAIGNPFGYQHTLTEGIVSAEHRDLEIENEVFPQLIQISAPINPGNSGGPLLNINGRVIGINTAIRRAAQGIGFAIPIDRLGEIIPTMTDIDHLRRIDFGLEVGELPATGDAARNNAPGVQVRRVRTDSAAARAGFLVGDVITALDARPVKSVIDFHLDMLEGEPGNTISFDIMRGFADPVADPDNARPGSHHKIALVLRQRPKPNTVALARELFGITVQSLSANAAKRYVGAAEAGDIVIADVESDSPADRAGIEAGDLLIGLGEMEIDDLDHLGLMLDTIEPNRSVKLIFSRVRRSGWGIRIVQYDRTLRTRDKENHTIPPAMSGKNQVTVPRSSPGFVPKFPASYLRGEKKEV